MAFLPTLAIMYAEADRLHYARTMTSVTFL